MRPTVWYHKVCARGGGKEKAVAGMNIHPGGDVAELMSMHIRKKAAERRGWAAGRAAAAATLVLAALMLLAAVPVSTADPLQDKKQRLEEIKREVQQIDARLETVVEQYNTTVWRLEKTREEIRSNENEIAAMNARIEERQDILGKRLRGLYMMGNTNALEVLLDCKTLDDLIANVPTVMRISEQDADIIKSVQEDREELAAANRQLEERKAELQAAAEEAARQKASIESELARRKELMAGVESEVNDLIRQEQEQAQRAAVNRTAPSPVNRSYPAPPPNPNAPAVVKVAYAQLGKPYQYAAAGPDRFDCSGLVMYCYAQVGVYLPHSSYAQFQCGYPVSYADLQPGDLVFFHGAGHVGMYIGDGQFIHAPHTGDVVRIADLGRRSDFCGARRPR